MLDKAAAFLMVQVPTVAMTTLYTNNVNVVL